MRLKPPCYAFRLADRFTFAQTRVRRPARAITCVPFPTYAAWRNPMENGWRLLQQTGGQLRACPAHRLRLKADATILLDRFADPTATLLRYGGLPPEVVYAP